MLLHGVKICGVSSGGKAAGVGAQVRSVGCPGGLFFLGTTSAPGSLVIVTHPGNQPALPSGTLTQLDTSLGAIGGTVARPRPEPSPKPRSPATTQPAR